MIRIKGNKEAQDFLRRIAKTNYNASGAAAVAGCLHIQEVMQTRFLNGQVIGKRKNDLFSKWSVRGVTSPQVGAILGTPVVYAAAQEYGYTEAVAVPAHSRRPPTRRRRTRTGRIESTRKWKARRTIFQESTAGGTFSISIRGYSRRMNLRPRAFLRGAIEATKQSLKLVMLDTYRRVIRAAE